ncbi:PTS glucose transporter subunit IIA [Bacillus luteolus]|uniref:PTS glucose transporter subunit IIA n=1 Tax=Litchfieldia luteola TaxID=682179 RepID=A0ABR9QFP3_9BACI|nr:PTS glucose transporter subunit IIA [Cytobacillus luteolus]MBE4907316.1 PTS glucose transporter subunit IIA [Cytobacillus luteolus]MBP1943862.1 PTS system glucose-specific IIA component [Cytobacillus luteolus]
MLKKLFGKSSEPVVEHITSPINGRVLDITEVPDPVFSQKMMGEGIAIEPADGQVVSPVDGEIVQVFPTKHAVGIKTKSGLEILIHIGLETVTLNGEGFESFVQAGDKVVRGDKLIAFDLNIIKEKAASTITPMIITNTDEVVGNLEKNTTDTGRAGETEVLTVTLK